MDTKNIQKYISLFILLFGIALFGTVVYLLVNEPWMSYQAEISKEKNTTRDLEKIKKEEKQVNEQESAERERLKSLKPIYKNETNADGDSTSAYGTMFESIINYAKQNGLMIRSIEYDMNPTYDPIFASYSDLYNVCEFKFYFVGTYNQFKGFLADVVDKFEYFIAVSKLDITAFPENTDYLLLKVSFTLYSEHGKDQQSVFKKNTAGRRARPPRPAPGNIEGEKI